MKNNCKLCGRKARLYSLVSMHRVGCDYNKCNASTAYYPSSYEAEKIWNRLNAADIKSFDQLSPLGKRIRLEINSQL